MSVARLTAAQIARRASGLVYLACPLPVRADDRRHHLSRDKRAMGLGEQARACAFLMAAGVPVMAPDLVTHEGWLRWHGKTDLPDWTALRWRVLPVASAVVVPPLGDCPHLEAELVEARARNMPVWFLEGAP